MKIRKRVKNVHGKCKPSKTLPFGYLRSVLSICYMTARHNKMTSIQHWNRTIQMTAKKKTKTKTNKQNKKKGKKGLEYRTKKRPISRHWQWISPSASKEKPYRTRIHSVTETKKQQACMHRSKNFHGHKPMIITNMLTLALLGWLQCNF